jgi:hypothetical protein
MSSYCIEVWVHVTGPYLITKLKTLRDLLYLQKISVEYFPSAIFVSFFGLHEPGFLMFGIRYVNFYFTTLGTLDFYLISYDLQVETETI